MASEETTTTTDQHGNTHTTTRIVESEGSSGGVAKWAFLAVLVAALGIGAYVMTQGRTAEIARDNAIAEAAGDVGEAAGQIGDAAQDAGDAAQSIADNAESGGE